MPVSSTTESATITQVNSRPTSTGTNQRGGAPGSISSQIASTGTAVPVWSGESSTIEVALSWGASIRPAASRARARPAPPRAWPLASKRGEQHEQRVGHGGGHVHDPGA